MKLLSTILVLTLLVGCRSPGKAMASWVGKPEAQLIASWGAPDSSMRLDDGSKVLTWKRIWSNHYHVGEGRQSFVISVNGMVQSWSYDNMPRF